jgi:proteic killer suppression protein
MELDTCNVTSYNPEQMIQNFKHKGLKQLFEKGSSSGLSFQNVKRLKLILALLETADTIEDMDLPGLNLHELKGKRKGTWSLKVTGNWRVTFKFEKGDALNVNYEDYH